MAVFAASGILHAFVAHVTFGGGELSSFAFFFASGGLVCLERWLDKNVPSFAERPKWLGWLLTMTTMAGLAPLYPGLFVARWPGWFVDNPITAPWPASVVGDAICKLIGL